MARAVKSAVKQRAKALIDELPEEVVENFIDFVQQLKAWEATREILEDEEFSKQIKKGLKDLEEERVIEWRKIKKTNV